MFKNVMIGVDGAEGGRDAIALASTLAAEDSELTLAYVYPGDPRVYRGSNAAYDTTERERSRELLEAEREEAGINAHVRWRGSASVGRGLHELAEAIEADLLVIGSSRHGLFGRVLIGDDTGTALNGAPCAVAIAPAGYPRRHQAMREIGVGYDGSPESAYALRVARTLAAEQDAKLSAFRAVSYPAYFFVGGAALYDGSILEDAIRDAVEDIAALGDVEPHAAYGQPGEELSVYSDSLDLLVIGSRGYGPIGRLVHGSTAGKLARTAHCPLLVLTRAAQAANTTAGPGEERETVAAGAAT